MTVTTLTSETNWLVADGVNKNWSFAFAMPESAMVTIQVTTDVDNEELYETYTSNFTLTHTNAAKTAGYVTYPSSGSALAVGKFVRIRREVPYTQTANIGSEGDFSPIIHERAFDRLTMQTQQLKRDLSYMRLENADYVDEIEAFTVQAGVYAAEALSWAQNSQSFSGSAQTAANLALAAAHSASGPVEFYNSYSAANAAVAGLSANQVVEVFQDENYGNARTRYRKEGGVLVFKVVLDAPDGVNILHFGAKPDWGVDDTDNTAAVQAAINAAYLTGQKVVAPEGHYWFSDQLDPGLSMTLVGVPGKTFFHFSEGTVGSPNCLFKNASNNPAKGRIYIFGLTVQGTFGDVGHTTGSNYTGALYFDHYQVIELDHCSFKRIGVCATEFHFNGAVLASHCDFEDVTGDGLRCRDCFHVFADRCRFRRNADDSISFHDSGYQPVDSYNPNDGSPRRAGLFVHNCMFLDGSACVTMLGARAVNLSHNYADRIRGGFAYIARVGGEGAFPVHDVVVESNIILNSIHNNAVIYIGPPDPRATAESGSVIPGQPKSDGTFDEFWEFRLNDYADATKAFPPAENISVMNNIIGRNLEAGVDYTDWGFGYAPNLDWEYDFAVTDDLMRPAGGINVVCGRNTQIKNNIVNHTDDAIFIVATYNTYPPIVGGDVSGNIIWDFTLRGITSAGTVTDRYIQLKIHDNIINGDVRRLNANSNADGTYDAGANQLPRAISLGTSYGADVADNTISNVAEVAQNLGRHTFRNNTLVCDAVSYGDNPGNKGIRVLPFPGRRFNYAFVYSDPTDYLNYGKIKWFMPGTGTAKPTSGYFFRGFYMENEDPVSDGYSIVRGWWRISNGNSGGTNHTLGTDWAEDVIELKQRGAPVSATWNIGTLVAGATATKDVTYSGAALGDFAEAAWQGGSAGLDGAMLTAYVSAVDTVTCVVFNPKGADSVNGNGTVRVSVRPK